MNSYLKKLLIRLKNMKVLISLISGILLILVNTGIIDVKQSEAYMETINIFLGLLVTLGIVSNPDNPVITKEAE